MSLADLLHQEHELDGNLVVVVAVATALAILAGWIDPNPGAFFAFVGDVVDAVVGFVADRLSGVVG